MWERAACAKWYVELKNEDRGAERGGEERRGEERRGEERGREERRGVESRGGLQKERGEGGGVGGEGESWVARNGLEEIIIG